MSMRSQIRVVVGKGSDKEREREVAKGAIN